MKHVLSPGTALLCAVLLASCATPYQPQSLTGGYSDFLTAPDAATVIFRGNGYTDAARLVELTALRCADVTLAHGYHYFVINAASDISKHFSFTTPGSAQTSGFISDFGNFNATTTYTPPQTFSIYKPALMVAIRMSNNEQALEPLGMTINGRRVAPKDAAFLSQSLRQFLGIKP
jgi:hypothetical protein